MKRFLVIVHHWDAIVGEYGSEADARAAFDRLKTSSRFSVTLTSVIDTTCSQAEPLEPVSEWIFKESEAAAAA